MVSECSKQSAGLHGVGEHVLKVQTFSAAENSVGFQTGHNW